MKISEITAPLYELFTQPVPVVPTYSSPMNIGFSFVVGGREFELSFQHHDASDYGDYDEHDDVALQRLGWNEYSDTMSPFETQKDFGGNPIQIYATVADLIKKYLHDRKPNKLTFFGFDEKQQSLYMRMIPYMQKYAGPDYRVSLDPKQNINFDRIVNVAPLHELFTQPVPVEHAAKGHYKFEVGGKQFALSIARSDNSFHDEVVLDRLSDISSDVWSSFATQKDFGSNPIQIYATVADLIKKHLQVNKPNRLTFYGFDKKQQSLYARMIPWMQKYAGPDYRVSQVHGHINFDRIEKHPLHEF